MSDSLKLQYIISDEDFTRAGEASGDVKSKLKMMGVNPEVIRKVSIAMYEGEINMVIHANGGTVDVKVCEDCVEMVLADKGPGIKNIEQAMQEGFSTASDNTRSLGFGAGMGLPNMKRYTDSMEIESTVGVGTTVKMKVNIN